MKRRLCWCVHSSNRHGCILVMVRHEMERNPTEISVTKQYIFCNHVLACDACSVVCHTHRIDLISNRRKFRL
jgi:ferredoxin